MPARLNLQPKRGFTLVELLVVISIIAILSVIGMTVFSGVQKSARDAKRRGDLDAIAKALEIYKSQNNTYTPSTTFPCLSGWSANFNHSDWGVAGSHLAGCVTSLKNAWAGYFAGNIPQDPFCNGTTCSGSNFDYWFFSDGSNFVVSAVLQTPPNPAMSGCQPGYNYCLKNQQ